MRLRRFILPIAILPALFVAYQAWPRDHVLTSDATWSQSIKDWEVDSANFSAPLMYKWISDTRMIHSRCTSEADWAIAIYDIDSRSDNKCAPKMANFFDLPLYDWSVSLDGKIAVLGDVAAA